MPLRRCKEAEEQDPSILLHYPQPQGKQGQEAATQKTMPKKKNKRNNQDKRTQKTMPKKKNT